MSWWDLNKKNSGKISNTISVEDVYEISLRVRDYILKTNTSKMLPVSLTVLKSQIKTVLSKRVYRDVRTKNKNCLFKSKLLKNCFQKYKQIPVNQIIYTFLQKYQMFQGSLWGTFLFSVIVKKLVCLMMIMISMSCFIVWLTKKRLKDLNS